MLYQSKQIMKIKAPPKLSETSGAFENTPVFVFKKMERDKFLCSVIKIGSKHC